MILSYYEGHILDSRQIEINQHLSSQEKLTLNNSSDRRISILFDNEGFKLKEISVNRIFVMNDLTVSLLKDLFIIIKIILFIYLCSSLLFLFKHSSLIDRRKIIRLS